MTEFYDTHAHLAYPDFESDLPQVLERAAASGVSRIITIGTDLESSRRVLDLSERYPQLWAAVGWHPNEAVQAPDDWRPALRELAAHPKVVAIGETGLDYYRLPAGSPSETETGADPARRRQAELFAQHLEVAAEFGLNCIIHQRSALEDVMALVRSYGDRVRAVFHCFADDPAVLPRLFALNALVSFTGILTFKNAANIRAALAAAPLGRFMLETDCPFLAPVPFRGKRCEPAYLKETATVAAQIKGCSLAELSAATCATAREFFPRLE